MGGWLLLARHNCCRFT